MSGRFSYVKYDNEAVMKQEKLKDLYEQVEATVDALIENGRAKSLVMTKLEESYMWTGKAIRDEQIARLPQTPHEPTRG